MVLRGQFLGAIGRVLGLILGLVGSEQSRAFSRHDGLYTIIRHLVV